MAQVPAKRYDLFITAFEKKVTEAQESIKRMDQLMRPYEVCRETLELFELENETRLQLTERGIHIDIAIMDLDREEKFLKLISKLGSNLLERKMHLDGQPSAENSGYSFNYTWRLQGFKDFKSPPRIWLCLNPHWDGSTYIKVEEIKRKVEREESDRRIFWVDQPIKRTKPLEDEIEF